MGLQRIAWKAGGKASMRGTLFTSQANRQLQTHRPRASQVVISPMTETNSKSACQGNQE